MRSLVYLAKPTYGGWVTFTAHLSKKFNFKIYKIGKRTEVNKDKSARYREYGYDSYYQNINYLDIPNLENIMITAIDKNYYKYLEYFPDGTYIVIHDPTEIKGKSCQSVIDNLSRFKVITIRKTVQIYLKENLNINSIFLHHPFYQYPKTDDVKCGAVSISRIDFDKHTDIILKANNMLDTEKIKIYGAKNDLYVYHHLTKKLNLPLDNYFGTFKKDFSELNSILSKATFVIDLSAIKNDGGGSQYTFLEAIYQDCVLILNDKWVNSGFDNNSKYTIESIFKDKENCFLIKNEQDLVNILVNKEDISRINQKSKLLLKPHLEVDWINLPI